MWNRPQLKRRVVPGLTPAVLCVTTRPRKPGAPCSAASRAARDFTKSKTRCSGTQYLHRGHSADDCARQIASGNTPGPRTGLCWRRRRPGPLRVRLPVSQLLLQESAFGVSAPPLQVSVTGHQPLPTTPFPCKDRGTDLGKGNKVARFPSIENR